MSSSFGTDWFTGFRSVKDLKRPFCILKCVKPIVCKALPGLHVDVVSSVDVDGAALIGNGKPSIQHAMSGGSCYDMDVFKSSPGRAPFLSTNRRMSVTAAATSHQFVQPPRPTHLVYTVSLLS